jgi:hypothetical protein
MVAMNLLNMGLTKNYDKQNANKKRIFSYGDLGSH